MTVKHKTTRSLILSTGDSQSGKKTVVRHLLGDTGDSADSEANSARREFALSYRFTQVRDDEGEGMHVLWCMC